MLAQLENRPQRADRTEQKESLSTRVRRRLRAATFFHGQDALNTLPRGSRSRKQNCHITAATDRFDFLLARFERLCRRVRQIKHAERELSQAEERWLELAVLRDELEGWLSITSRLASQSLLAIAHNPGHLDDEQ